jgi:signal-transduction protein with cAMP-binding, CBS, and nucleotidyltransferase domain
LGHQQYYDAFVTMVENVATHVVVQESGKLVEAKRLLQLLFQKHY